MHFRRTPRQVFATGSRASIGFRGFWWCLAWSLWLFLGFAQRQGAAEGERTPGTDYVVDVWQTDQGLPQGTVTSVVQTHDGYLWLGTFNGLVRFDGLQFRILNSGNNPGLTSGRIVQLFEDSHSRLWVGSEEGQLFQFHQGQFSEFHPPNQGSTARLLRQLCEDGEGRLWLLSYESNITRFANGAFESVGPDWMRQPANVNSLAVDLAGHVWAATPSVVATWKQNDFEPVWPAGKQGFEVLGLTRAHEGGVWAACRAGRLLWLRRITASGIVANAGPFPLPSRPVSNVIQDRAGWVWIGTSGDGIYRCQTNGQWMEINGQKGLPNGFIRSLTEDREGNIWVGMQGGGLARLKPSLFQNFRKQDGLSSDEVLSATEGEPGELWVGTNGEYLNRIRAGHTEVFGEEHGIRHPNVWSVLRDHEARLWVGTYGGGLYRQEGDRFEPFQPSNVASGLFPGAPLSPIVPALFEDSQGVIWLGQQTYGTITRIIKGEPVMMSIPGAPSNLDIRCITEDGSGAVWIGTHGSGIYRFKDDLFTHFGKAEGLGSDFVWVLHTDTEGIVWAGTYQGGLSGFQGDHFKALTTREGLPSDVVCQILEDDGGDLWIGSYGGVSRIRRTALKGFLEGETSRVETQNFTKADGLPSVECTGGFQPSGCKLSDGRLCFSTVKGLALIHPKTAVPNPVPPEVRIEAVYLDGEKVWDSLPGLDSRKTGVVEEESITHEPWIRVKPGLSRLEFRFTGLSFVAPEQVNFRARLNGLDSDWVDLGTRRQANYSHLGPGDYTFEVSARNTGLPWNEQGVHLRVQILPYLWQTLWFKWLVPILVISAVAIVARLVERRRQSLRMAVLERQRAVEVERLRIAQDIHDDLGARLTEITLLSELAHEDAAQSGTSTADLDQIAFKARELTRSVDEIVWAVNPSNDNLESMVTYACGYAEDYLRPTQIRCRFDLPATIPKIPFSADVRHQLFLAFKEAIANVAKHSNATAVTITVTPSDHQFVWSVTDNGTAVASKTPRHTGGNGLGNMKRRLEQIGGRCEIEGGNGTGFSVTFSVPFPKISNE